MMRIASDRPRLIAVDWGTTRLRAYLLDNRGMAVARIASDTGIQSVPAGGFPSVLEETCSAWLALDPDLPILMAGMVGSRNGWVETPYVRAPCGIDDLARGCVKLEIKDGALAGRDVWVVPGIDIRWPDGCYDVMRGEETQAIGAGLTDGLVCHPGTHSKWIEIKGGRVTRFATFITGELYAAITGSFVARLAEAPDEPSVPEAGRSAQMKGGLARALFQARARILAGDMKGAAVRPFISTLLVESEVAGVLDLFGPQSRVYLVATHPQLDFYKRSLAQRSLAVPVVDPERAFLVGATKVFATAGLGGGNSVPAMRS